ncbi:LysM peptidoglycan-binding domain-containing protein [Streptomyces lydicus]|uniref:LysM peptidoglycan-binding domain-containing protein n=1 Tax=Streptomyces lydicus TaxID=47763 RepID=UPI0036E6C08E
MTSLPPRSAPPLRPGAVLRAVASTLVLAAVVVAVPVVLALATPLMWANGHDALAHLLTRPDSSGSAFVLVLLALAWLAWAQFTVCAVVEACAQARGRAVRPLRGFALSQRAAAALISSIVVLLPTGTALAAPAPAHAQAASVHASAAHSSTSPTAAAEVAQASPAAAGGRSELRVRAAEPRVIEREVRAGESLWSIAEDEFGDGERWREIARANEGRRMADGRTFHAEEFLQVGWTLRLPAPQAPPGPGTARSVTVRAGQTLSQIAQEQLGNANRYPEIFQANRGKAQPDGGGFDNPDRIVPGQHLTLPTTSGHRAPRTHTPDAHGSTAQPAAPTPSEAPTPEPSKAHPTKPHPAAPSPRAPQTTTPTPQPGDSNQAAQASPHRPAPQPTRPASHSPGPATPHATDAAPAADSFNLQRLAGIGALLAASIIGALGIKRILQQRRRRPGETIAMPTETSRLEQALTAAAEPASVQLLDRALRTLHHHLLVADGPALPQLRGARVTGRTVELLPEDREEEPLPPFKAGSEGWWTLPDDADLLPEDAARTVPAPWPGLVTIGASPDGDLMLLNLPHTRTVLLEGAQGEVRTVARAIAMEAATCTWSDRTEILTIGLGDDLAALLPQGRIRAVPHLRAAARDLGELLLEHHQAPADEAKPLPWLLICAATANADDAWELADALAAARDLPVALVVPAAGAAGCYPEAETLNAADPAPQTCAALASPLVLQRVEDQDYAQFVEDLRKADEPARPAEGPWRNVPDDHAAEDSGADSAVAQATPFTSLVASAGPATVHLLPSRTPAPGADADPDTPHTAGASAPGSVIQLTKAQSAGPAVAPDLPLDEDAPEISVLGPVTVTGIAPSGHGPKLAALAALLFFRPGRGADALQEAMGPNSPWSRNTLQARMSELRSRLGSNADGELYLPRDRSAGYRLSPAVRCDWPRFQALAERGLSLGPERGIVDLEQALSLVRGRPFGGGDYPWAAPLVQEMLSRIVDVAHTVALWRRVGPRQDLAAAHRAITTGLNTDDTAELLYRDWMLIERDNGNRAGVHRAIAALQDINRRLDVGMEPETEAVIMECLSTSSPGEVFAESANS